MDVSAIRLQMKDGVPDELSRTVVGHVTAATRVVHRDPLAAQLILRRHDVRRLAPRLRAERDDGRMFEQHEGVADGVRTAFFDQPGLQRETVWVGQEAGAEDGQGA